MFTIYVGVGLILLVATTLLWLISLLIRDSSIMDIFWGAGSVAAGWLYAFLPGPAWTPRQILILSLLTLWGVRLSLHILSRNLGKGEDFRYRAWRKEAGEKWWWRSYFQVFLLQGFLIWVISLSLMVALGDSAPTSFVPLDGLAVAMWTTGFIFEVVADSQLRRFREDPGNEGRVLNGGLWRYSRHPNYFGEAVIWWSFYAFAAASGGWWALLSPLLMTFLLVRVSGVRMLEKSLMKTKPEYARYRASTNALVPWFPRTASRD